VKRGNGIGNHERGEMIVSIGIVEVRGWGRTKREEQGERAVKKGDGGRAGGGRDGRTDEGREGEGRERGWVGERVTGTAIGC